MSGKMVFPITWPIELTYSFRWNIIPIWRLLIIWFICIYLYIFREATVWNPSWNLSWHPGTCTAGCAEPYSTKTRCNVKVNIPALAPTGTLQLTSGDLSCKHTGKATTHLPSTLTPPTPHNFSHVSMFLLYFRLTLPCFDPVLRFLCFVSGLSDVQQALSRRGFYVTDSEDTVVTSQMLEKPFRRVSLSKFSPWGGEYSGF